ncbi:MAG: NUDIX domain-containing protein [Eubacterium sp.]|nr:NUDIX domain-containing protein [Eubacterium sp.]MDD7210470.1 NUDIX domain-containing protein [Lachnospiraceae bacterium]MDY5497876.1 NUDIX domain-containing protein [Anaerobutyricum sp.]
MEYLDLRDEDGNSTGIVRERKLVHRDGDLHGTSHVWIVRPNKKSGWDVLLQKRSQKKDAFPGCYDISSAGHLPAGQDFLPSALRELKEELGIEAEENQLHFLGIHKGYSEEIFYGEPFRNYEISHVYLYTEPVDIGKLKLQEDEVDSVCWMDLQECYKKTEAGEKNFCLLLDELDMIKEYFNLL